MQENQKLNEGLPFIVESPFGELSVDEPPSDELSVEPPSDELSVEPPSDELSAGDPSRSEAETIDALTREIMQQVDVRTKGDFAAFMQNGDDDVRPSAAHLAVGGGYERWLTLSSEDDAVRAQTIRELLAGEQLSIKYFSSVIDAGMFRFLDDHNPIVHIDTCERYVRLKEGISRVLERLGRTDAATRTPRRHAVAGAAKHTTELHPADVRQQGRLLEVSGRT